jgi:tRNA(Ile)-lysidine synthase
LVRTALEAVPDAFGASPWEETVDADAVGGALVLRAWRAGDRVRPVGGGGERLVSDLLREAGVPPSERAGRLVVEAGGRVAWVVGVRLAAWAGVTAATRRAERWTWAPEMAGGVVGDSRTG